MTPKRKSNTLLRSNSKDKKVYQDKAVSDTLNENKTNKSNEGKTNTAKNNIENSPPQIERETMFPIRFKQEETIIKKERTGLDLNQLLQRRTQINSQGSICWKVFLFPPVQQLGLQKVTQQYFGLDLVEAGTERTLWTHKANIWENLFDTVKELSMKGDIEPISDMFDGILSCPVRAISNGPNEIETLVSGKGQKIQHWIMLIPMPADVDSENYIQEYLSTFLELCKKDHIRSAYKSGVEAFTKHPKLMEQISEDGNYWYIMDNALKNDVIFRTCKCLSEVLLDFTIQKVVRELFGMNNNSNTWTAAVKAYAFEA